MAVIGLDARKYNDYGIGTYIRNLVLQYPSLRPFDRYLLFVAPGDGEVGAGVGAIEHSAVRYGKYSAGEFFLFGRRINASGVSVFHSPHYTLPYGIRPASVVTVHDLIHLKFREYYSSLQRSYSYAMVRHAIKASAFVITDSEATRRDLLELFRADEKKIVTIHLGVSGIFRRDCTKVRVEQFCAKYAVRPRYILFVGNTKPHKGLDILLKSFKDLVQKKKDLDLVLVGGSIPPDSVIGRMIEGLGLATKVRSLGRISDEEVFAAYHGAEMLLLPSRYEGFGLTALEAMASGTPAIVSDAGSLPEVVGDAAIICPSGDTGAFTEAISSLESDGALRRTMIERGLNRAKMFDWNETARKTLEVYDNALNR